MEVLDALVVSDIHLGSPCCEAALFLDFLNNLPPTNLFIIAGDLLEGETYTLNLQEAIIFKQIQKIAKKIRTVWVQGNHDNWAKRIQDNLKNVEVVKDFSFVTENTKSPNVELLVTHGDQFDDYLKKHPTQTEVGAYLHNLVGKFSRPFAGWLKKRCKGYTHAVEQVKTKAIQWAYENMTCGGNVPPFIIICGHTHSPEVYQNNFLTYANAGSWTEGKGNYLAIKDGQVQLKEWK